MTSPTTSTYDPKKLKQIRQKLGWTQSQLAEKIGVSLASIKSYETNANDIKFEIVRRLLQVEEVRPYALWFVTGSAYSFDQADPTTTEEEQQTNSAQMTTDEIEQSFVDGVTEALLMFTYFGWIKIDKDKIDFDACGKYVLKQVSPTVKATFQLQDIQKLNTK
ncbi:helix-turn-helix domain-containing protein [Pseudoalteromonas obscura]|uniref:Helix-turn-helix transcriptional regulator n=1 Tax=Pseudoalteromonas obscura TaxID=3048491 RepID=A0ABT7EJN9_9GAMM|nr:helix-turn-helix transcriptional regulator [Pseudoalteromonas sp. P94(2023)]MDK2595233.1 helix-turn-helix transcriptional regulator [Pseudoalteromonas sp. P94(2023)]